MTTTELKVLNSLCKTKDIQTLFAQNVDPMFDLYSDAWLFIKEYYAKHRAIPDATILEDRFQYFDVVDAPGETSYYMDTLREEFLNGKLEQVAFNLKTHVGKVASNAVLNSSIRDLMELQGFSTQTEDLEVTDFDRAAERYEHTRMRAHEMGGTPGIPTGIGFMDSANTAGLCGGDLVVVLGWTGRAKSLLTTMIACNAFAKGFKPMIISLEMNAEKVQDRIYTMMGNGLFKNSELAMGDIDEDNFRTWSKGVSKGKGFVVISHSGTDEVTPASVQSKFDQHKPDIVIFDYAQLAADNANSSDMTARMRNMSKEYKRFATANNVPFVLISSATPDSSASINTPPIIEQVAWSKQLAFDADLAFAVHRHDTPLEDNWVIIEIVCRKNRNGELFSGYFKADINRGIYEEFYDLSEIGQM